MNDDLKNSDEERAIPTLAETQESVFIAQYKEVCGMVEGVRESAFASMEKLADLGQTLDEVKSQKGKFIFAWLQNLPIESPVQKVILEMARKAYLSRTKGREIEGKQLFLLLGMDEEVTKEPVTRVKRDSAGKYMRYAKLTFQSLQKEFKERPVSQMSINEASQMKEQLRPVIEIAFELEKRIRG